MLKRTSINSVNKLLKANPDWNVLDIGCGYTANKHATIVADAKDLSNFYKDKKFIKITEKKLPFKDNEFNFVVTSHVIEHIKDSPMKLNITRKFEIGGDSSQASGFQLLRAGPSDYQRKVI